MDEEPFELKEREPWRREHKSFFTVGLIIRLVILVSIFAASFILEPIIFGSPSGFITGGIVALPALPVAEAATSSVSIAGVLTLLIVIAVIPSLIFGYRRKKRQEALLWERKKPIHHGKDFAARLEQVNQELATVRAQEPAPQNVILQLPKHPVPRKGVRLRKDHPMILASPEENSEWNLRLKNIEEEIQKYADLPAHPIPQDVSKAVPTKTDVTQTLSKGLDHSLWLLKNITLKR